MIVSTFADLARQTDPSATVLIALLDDAVTQGIPVDADQIIGLISRTNLLQRDRAALLEVARKGEGKKKQRGKLSLNSEYRKVVLFLQSK